MLSQTQAKLASVTSDNPTTSTGRLLLDAAPGGLSVVQDLLNTAGLPTGLIPDLLADPATTQTWLAASLRTWAAHTGRPAPRVTITSDDLPALRELRASIRGWLRDDSPEQPPHPLTADVSQRDGRLVYEPRSFASMVLLEALLASHTGTLRRLKTCQNPACGAAFYDQSRNATRVWHDMKTCGNTMNLRASRARRRQSPQEDQASGDR